MNKYPVLLWLLTFFILECAQIPARILLSLGF